MDEPVVQDQPVVNIAEMLAKQGIKTDDSPVVIPEVKSEPVTETKQEKPAQEAAKTEAETAKVESPPEPVKPVEAPAPAPVVQPAAEINWREVLKKQPEVEVLKEIGLDEKMINFLSKWRSGEDLRDYLEAVTVDYSKMAPEELMKRQLMKEYGGIVSQEDFEELYRMKVIEQYKLDADVYDEKEVRRGKLLLGVDADKIRQDLVKRQQELLLSKPPAPGPDLAAQAEQEQRQRDFDSYKQQVETNQYTKELLGSKLLKIGDGEKAFNLEIASPQNLLDLLYDPAKWSQKLWNADGTPNIRKQLLLSALAEDDGLFLTNLSKHYETLGAKKVIEPIENPSPPPGAPTAKGDPESQDVFAQLAKYGKVTSGE